MQVEILNQYTQTWKVDGHETVETFRTRKTLEKLRQDLDFESRVVDGEWIDDGQVTCILADVQQSNGDAGTALDFNKKKKRRFDYYTLDELKEYDLIYVKDFGIVHDGNVEEFEKDFKVTAQKK